jgi:hypothetical protein
VEQRTEEWYESRLGIPTGSCFDRIVTMKGEPSKQAEKYMYQLAGELLSGERENCYQSADMLRGTELESEARLVYEMENEVEVVVPGFQLASCGLYGGSADGLVGSDGMIEIKCPKASTHIEYLESGKLPSTYFQQVHGYMLIYSRQWCDFFSYFPGIKPFQVRVYPDTKFQEKLHGELVKFCEALKKLVDKVRL